MSLAAHSLSISAQYLTCTTKGKSTTLKWFNDVQQDSSSEIITMKWASYPTSCPNSTGQLCKFVRKPRGSLCSTKSSTNMLQFTLVTCCRLQHIITEGILLLVQPSSTFLPLRTVTNIPSFPQQQSIGIFFRHTFTPLDLLTCSRNCYTTTSCHLLTNTSLFFSHASNPIVEFLLKSANAVVSIWPIPIICGQ